MQKTLFYLITTILFLTFNTSLTSGQQYQTEHTGFTHFDPTIVDGHVDTMMKVIDEDTWLPKINIGENTAFELDIPKAQAGGINAPFFAAYTSGYYGNNPRSISETLALINALYWTEEQNPEDFKIATTTGEIRRAITDKQIAAIPSIEGAYSLEKHNAIGLLHQYNDLGIRMIGFNWNFSNALGEGADEVYGNPERTPSEGGLTAIGAEVAEEMNRIGMIIDVSHMSRNTFWDVIEISEAPILASHSGVNALKDHQRNLTDEQLLALKENGGVISIVFYPAFITDNATGFVSDVVDHIDYAVDLIGIDHVGLGSDFDGATLPSDLENAADMSRITEELIIRGYTTQEIEQILGGNILRVMEEVEQASENELFGSDSGLVIIPAYEMGEIIDNRTPLLTAEIEEKKGINLDKDSFKVIVDGVSYDELNFDEEASKLSLQLTEELQERFHMVTFEVADMEGGVTRETRIFYIGD